MKKAPSKPIPAEQTSAEATDETEPTVMVPSKDKPKSKIDLSYVLPIAMMVLIALIIVPATKEVQTLLSRAASPKCKPIIKVQINPGEIIATGSGSPIELSVLAYDMDNNPVSKGVKYDWGISSTNSIGTVKARHDLATFTPLTGGIGDLYVKANSSCTLKAALGSIKVTVTGSSSPTPTPTPRGKKNK